MKVRLKTSGGLANLRIDGEIDTGQLSPEISELIERGLESEALRQSAATDNFGVADGTVYELTIPSESEDGERRHYVLDDTTASDEVLDVLDILQHEIIRLRRDEVQATDVDATEGDSDGDG